MSLGKRLFLGGEAVCSADSVHAFGAESAYISNVALYQLDGNANDAVGNYNGTSYNITYPTGKFDKAARFNGASGRITTSGLKGYSKQTWSFWINPDVVNSRGHLMGTYPSGTIGQGAMYVELQSNGNVEAGVRNSSGSTSSVITTTPLTASQWHHIVVTSSGSELKLYINNASPITTSATVTTLDSTNVGSLAIGYEQRNNTHYFDGLIDQVRIYDKALSSFEVDVLYNETTDTVSDINVLGEGSGIALYTLDYDASDESGNYDGTPTDVEFGVDGQINWGASFNGSSSEIEFTTDSNFVNDFSISAWINMNQLPASAYLYQVVAWGDEATGERRSLGIWNGGSGDPKVYFSGFGSAANFGGSTSVSANQWYHVCVTRSGSTVKVYLDGNLDGTGTVTLNSYTGTTGRIGNSASANEHFNGSIDQVRIFQKALSSDEVDTLYGETACVYTSTTDTVDYQGTNIAYYKLDGNALDETSNNYDAAETDITYEFGRFGQAAVFNGSSSKIVLPSGSPFDDSNTIKSISGWVKADTTTSRVYLYSHSSSTEASDFFYIAYQADVNRVFVSARDGSTSNQSKYQVDITPNTNWNHIVAQLNGSTVEIWLNGVQQTVTNTTTGTATSSSWIDYPTYNNSVVANIGISRVQSPVYSAGKIDQVRIFDSALDATAVENLYNEKQAYITKNASDPFGDNSEISFYDFESNAGNTSQDATGNNDAYFTNGVTFTSGSGLFGTYAAYLNGSNNYITFNVLAGITTDYSFSLWAIPHASTNFPFLTSNTGSTSTNYLRFALHQNGNYYFDFGNNTTARMTGVTPSEWRDGNWHHFTWVSSSTEKHVYVDGSLYNSISSTLGVSNQSTVTLGHYLTNYASGYYDQVRVFDRALDGDEVFKLYAEVIN